MENQFEKLENGWFRCIYCGSKDIKEPTTHTDEICKSNQVIVSSKELDNQISNFEDGF